MTDMVWKVANAIGDHIEEAHISQLKIAARAAIRALMEPTEEMRQVIEPALDQAYNGTKDCSVEAAGVQVFQAMLKAALDEDFRTHLAQKIQDDPDLETEAR